MDKESFKNVYEDQARADAYAKLEFPATYYLAFRDLPDIIHTHVQGSTALDFGCGAGRSTRFLRQLGFTVTGVDISENMLNRAKEMDPAGDYRLIPDGDLSALPSNQYNLILAAFTFDNVPFLAKKIQIFQSLRGLLAPNGCIINLVSAPEIYLHEWTSFSTKDFPENRSAKSGDIVRIVMLDVEDRRPVQDELCTDADYREVYRQAGLSVIRVHHPLGNESEPYPWVSETTVSPWAIYVLESGK